MGVYQPRLALLAWEGDREIEHRARVKRMSSDVRLDLCFRDEIPFLGLSVLEELCQKTAVSSWRTVQVSPEILDGNRLEPVAPAHS